MTVGKASKNTLARVVLAIQETLSGKEWSADTCQEITDIMERCGFEVKDSAEDDDKGEDI